MGIDDHNPDNLASKVDALLGKHGAGAGIAGGTAPRRPGDAMLTPDDRNIPLLTDIIDAPAWPEPHALNTLDTLDTLNTLNIAPLASAPSPLESLSDAELDLLAHDIFSRVFDRLDGPLGTKIEERLKERIGAQINAAVVNVLGDMRQEIANEIGDAVNAALADQLRNTDYRK
jgi:hypothetical protein